MVRILIFEDTPTHLDLLRKNLEGEGREILEARDPQEAASYIDGEHLDLIVADNRYQGEPIDKEAGLKLLAKSKARDETVQVILVTNYATPETGRKAMDAGAFDVLDRTPGGGFDFWAMLRAKADLALRYRELLLRDRGRKTSDDLQAGATDRQ